ncbi:MAG: site-specific integrase [Desulfobacterales bacterium]
MAILAVCPACYRQQKVANKRCAACGLSMDKFKKAGKVKYWVTARDQDGKQIRKSVGSFEGLKATSIADARKAENKVKTQKTEKRPLFNLAPGADVTFEKLSTWYRSLSEVKSLKSFDRIELILANFNTVHGSLLVNDLNLGDLIFYQNKRLGDNRSPRTVDYELSVIKTMVNRAFNYQKIDGKPLLSFKLVKRKLKTGKNARTQTLSCGDYLNLIAEAPQHLRSIVIMAYHTGMRLGELLGLRWPYVDRKAAMIRLAAELVKTDNPRRIPINHHVEKVLAALPRSINHDYVFMYRGAPVACIKKSFISACDDAGVVYGRKVAGGMTFHDIRRTAKTNMLAAGLDKNYRDLIIGHELTGMDRNYIAPPDEQLTVAMDKYTTWIDAELEKANVLKTVKKTQIS